MEALRWVLIVGGVLAVTACPGPAALLTDSGPVDDGGAAGDAGAAVDSGSAADAGSESDGGPVADAGQAADSGPAGDGGLDGGSPDDAGPGSDGGAAADDGGMRLFITSNWYGGNLGGQAGADAKCELAARGALKGGTWKAWLSTGTVAAPSRLIDVGPWSQSFSDGGVALTFDNLAHLNSTPIGPILVNERGDTHYDYGTHLFWTGTAFGGTPSNDTCSGFTTDYPGSGLVGISGTDTWQWTASGSFDCSWFNSLLCLEQSHSPAAPAKGTGSKRLFVTQGVFPADLGGLGGGDAKCNAAAQAAGKGGSWKAWLSTLTNAPSTRITEVGPWYQQFADGGVQLTFANVANLGTTPWTPVVVDEWGAMRSTTFWSGAIDGNTPGGRTCADFTSSDPGLTTAVGVTGVTSKWTNSQWLSCSTPRSILCFEQ